MSKKEVIDKLAKLVLESRSKTVGGIMYPSLSTEIAEYLVKNEVTIPEWVSVDERLPEESLNSVLGWDGYRERCVFVQYYKGEWILGNHESVKVTHWMPLPQPPKEAQR